MIQDAFLNYKTLRNFLTEFDLGVIGSIFIVNCDIQNCPDKLLMEAKEKGVGHILGFPDISVNHTIIRSKKHTLTVEQGGTNIWINTSQQ